MVGLSVPTMSGRPSAAMRPRTATQVTAAAGGVGTVDPVSVPAPDITAPAFHLCGAHPADRVMSHQALTSEVYLHGDPPPSRNQVAAVLRALADHTHNAHMLSDAVRELGADRAHLGPGWAQTSGLGRYFHGLADHLETWGRSPTADAGPAADLAELRAALRTGDASDGHHTHNELYAYRLAYHAHAARGWLAEGVPVVKSRRHADGTAPLGGGWFIVTATLPTGQVSNHYRDEHWDLFDVPEVDLPPAYDGHTPATGIDRLLAALATAPAVPDPIPQHDRVALEWHDGWGYRCPQCRLFVTHARSSDPLYCPRCTKAVKESTRA